MASVSKELTTKGKKTKQVPVSIGYRILELFSGGLYSSPNKAIEELVANSYDAMATKVHVVLPNNLEVADAVIWVVDDGESMGEEGFVDLWKIAHSRKRDPDRESTTRPPIGRFGIGKLATYVLASQLTYVTKHGGKYRAVTMDYSNVDQSQSAENEKILLDLRELTESEAKTLLEPFTSRKGKGFQKMPLFGQNAMPTWTVAALGNLKGLAHRLTAGRLKYVLSTALPLSPKFTLYFNGDVVQSSKVGRVPIRTWLLGVDDKAAADMRLQTRPNDVPPAVELDGIGDIHGEMAIYEDPLTGGKSEDMGRSHGIFVMVRGRLVNIDDALFGLPALSHGPFSRFRLVVHADGLDEVLRSTREAVLETSSVLRLRHYLQAKFNEARNFYNDWLASKTKAEQITTRVDSTPQSVSRRPMVNAIRNVLNGQQPPMLLTALPRQLDAEGKTALIEQLEASVDTESGFIRTVELASLGIRNPLVRFEAATGRVLVNSLHPFYANYADLFASPEPFELLAIAEVLTEAYLLEEDIEPEVVHRIIWKRDRFLRELVYSRQLSAPLVAEYLRDNADSDKGLEKAVAAGLANLGFEVSPIGGSGEPDGTALARLGIRDEESGKRADYLITYDAKSTASKAVKAHTVGTGGIERHRRQYNAQYSLVVAPNFEGADDPESSLNVEAKQQGITMLTIDQFIRLILAAATRQLGFSKLKELFDNCRTTLETKAWIDALVAQTPDPGPLPDILDAIWDLQKAGESVDPIDFSHVTMVPKIKAKKLRKKEIAEWLQSVRRLAGGYVTIEGERVTLEAPPERILRELRLQTKKLPEEFAPAGGVDEDEDEDEAAS